MEQRGQTVRIERMETGRRTSLPRACPESLGIPSRAVERCLDEIAARGIELHSFMLMRHGQVAAEGWWSPYRTDDKHMLFSLSKSFTSTAVGFAASEGRLSLDDKVVDWFPDDLPADVSPYLAEMRIRHLLMMGTGHTQDTTDRLVTEPEGRWVRAFLAAPVEREPGTHFVYNNGATYALSVILRQATGMPLLDYLKDRLFVPLGIPDATWEIDPRGIAIGAWGLSLRTEDIAKFGQLFLQDGVWEGRRILPEGWTAEASAGHIANGDDPASDWNQGYGYQFWRCRHGAYRGDGAFGQFCIVLPEQQAVVAMTAATNDMQGVLDAVWEHLLPAMRAEGELASNIAASEALAERLRRLAIDPPESQSHEIEPLERRLGGSVYTLDDNAQGIRTIRLDFAEQEAVLTLTSVFGREKIRLGRREWLPGKAHLITNPALPLNMVAGLRIESSMSWRGDGVLAATIRAIETPYVFTFVTRLDGDDGILFEMNVNVSLFPTGPAQPIRGRMADPPRLTDGLTD